MVAVQLTPGGPYFKFSGGDGSQANPYTPGDVATSQNGNWAVTANLGTLNGAATETTLGQIKALLQNDVVFTESIWTDDSGTFYVRRVEFNETTDSYAYSFTLPSGASYTPSTNPRPASSVAELEVREERFIATAGGTGYATNDVIGLVAFYNIASSPPTVSATIWYNLTSNSAISAPTIGNLREVSKGWATEAKQDSLIALFPSALSNGYFQMSLKEAIAISLAAGSNQIGTVLQGPAVNASVITETALTAAGSTTSRQLAAAGYSKFSYQVDLATVGTNVVIRIEGTNNGTTWANLSGDQTLTANGVYMYSFDGIMAANVRLTFVSAAGGGTPSVVGCLLRGN